MWKLTCEQTAGRKAQGAWFPGPRGLGVYAMLRLHRRPGGGEEGLRHQLLSHLVITLQKCNGFFQILKLK